MLQNGGDLDGCGDGVGIGKMVAVYFVIIRKWSEVLQRRTIWHGCTDQSSVGGV